MPISEGIDLRESDRDGVKADGWGSLQRADRGINGASEGRASSQMDTVEQADGASGMSKGVGPVRTGFGTGTAKSQKVELEPNRRFDQGNRNRLRNRMQKQSNGGTGTDPTKSCMERLRTTG
ncbi:hypothetical protein LXL04_010719 [Taraxacum kok-saghyz]